MQVQFKHFNKDKGRDVQNVRKVKVKTQVWVKRCLNRINQAKQNKWIERKAIYQKAIRTYTGKTAW